GSRRRRGRRRRSRDPGGRITPVRASTQGTGGARALPALLAVLLLAGCGPNDTDPGPGGVTVGEARALDQAAEMLDKQRLPDEALPPAPDAAAAEADTQTRASAPAEERPR